MSIAVECLVEAGALLGEGPTWHAERAEVIWVDILRGEVHATDLDGGDRIEQRHDVPVGAVALTANGEILAATPRGLCRVDGEVVAPLPAAAPDLRMNDGKPDPGGRFTGGTMTIDDPRDGAGSLWSLDGGGARRLVADATIPNGLAWSGDGARFYWIDTPTRRVDVFDYDADDGRLRNRRPLVQFDDGPGVPDGMCIDADDGLWIAFWGGGEVRRYVGGVCEERIVIPTPHVTCPVFAGPDLDQLVITTASCEFDEPPPGAGHVYLAAVGVTGTAPFRLGAWAT